MAKKIITIKIKPINMREIIRIDGLNVVRNRMHELLDDILQAVIVSEDLEKNAKITEKNLFL